MTTYQQIKDIKRYTENARIKAKYEYWIECKDSMLKAIELIDDL